VTKNKSKFTVCWYFSFVWSKNARRQVDMDSNHALSLMRNYVTEKG